jgi:hypothetical protein
LIFWSLARVGEKEGALGNRSSQFGGENLHISARDFTRGFHLAPIYHSIEFQSIWRSPSTGPNYWVSAVFRRAQSSLEFQSFEEQILVFQPETSGGGLPCPDLSFHRVSGYLEGSSSRAELLDFYSQPGGRNFSQGGLDLTLEGKKLILYCTSACI